MQRLAQPQITTGKGNDDDDSAYVDRQLEARGALVTRFEHSLPERFQVTPKTPESFD